ncbi:cation:proton antiporter [Halorarum salinum]|uniref:Cation:proton antiporter n=1 Tax=Halorarum salinum TaxID=2743089 RepID=A0A7D5LBQ9_9EURY|nr:cation:proton antiporter [Halobaculum salinum]QLG62790.1 cation:proton antiporter [Halobaculum salinum]
MVSYEVGLIVAGVAILAAVVLPRFLSGKPLSIPIIYVAAGFVLFSLPLGVQPPNPIAESEVTERLTELVVIISIMGAGLKIDRPLDLWSWGMTWRLLGVAMPLTIALTALLGYWVLGALPAVAVLLGAVVAPTDPVLASEVQTTAPTESTDETVAPGDQEDDVRFALTSEAGLNDGLAFPFTNLAIAMAGAATLASTGWVTDWLLVDVVYKVAIGLFAGYGAGWLMASFVFRGAATSEYDKILNGAEALATTLITYGVTELVHGYGFIAVFVAARELRHYEWDHDYHFALHDFAVMTERLLMAAVLVLFGGVLAGGLLRPLSPMGAAVALALVFVVRPLSGVVSLVGSPLGWAERLVISLFGIRGIGSFFYLSHALSEASFREAQLLARGDELWAFVGFVVLVSIVLHGVLATPVMRVLK